MYAVLQLVVEGSKTESELGTVARYEHLLGVGHVVVEAVGESRTLYLGVEEEVGDAQLEHRGIDSHQFLLVHLVVAVDGTKQDISIGHRGGRGLGDNRLVDTLEVGVGGKDALAGVERTYIIIGGKPHLALVVERQTLDFLRRQLIVHVEVLEQPAALRVLACGAADAAAVGAHPHVALGIAVYAYDVV